MGQDFTTQKAQASGWFRTLRDQIVTAFQALEDSAGSTIQFEVTPTSRADGGGGIMSVLRGGAVFEKVGVNWSEVHGVLGAKAQQAMAARGVPGVAGDGRFWASGISLVAHMANPHCPAVHMNTRMFWTPGAWWFGGGSDLNPCLEYPEDTAHFHGQMQAACDAHDPTYYPKFKAWADEYFFIPHRGRARGVGGIFYDDLNSGDWARDFAFTQDVGRHFLPAFVPVTERHIGQPWTEADREAQLIHRGLYAEYNLVYDRGTKFGLESGHDANAVLMKPAAGGKMDLNLDDEKHSFLLALQFLTRLPVQTDGFTPDRMAASPRYYPAVGAVVGAAVGVVYLGAAWVWPGFVAAFLALAVGVLITGGLHEDGFADACDGLGGGKTKDRALAIMRDSRIGSYGALGLILMVGGKAAALQALSGPVACAVLIAGHTASRGAMLWVMTTMPYARDQGAGSAVAQPQDFDGQRIAGATVALALVPLLFVLPFHAIVTGILGLVAGLFAMRHRFAWLGGYTGDCLGAVQQCSELGFLLGCLVFLT